MSDLYLNFRDYDAFVHSVSKTFTIQFFCGLLILDLSLHYKTYNQLNNVNERLEITVQAIKLKMIKVKSKSKRLLNNIIHSTLKAGI